MKQRVGILIRIFIYFIILFLIGKVFFILSNFEVLDNYQFLDIVRVFYHGLPLDLSMSGYLSALPAVLLIISVWLNGAIVEKVLNVYFLILSVLLVTIAVVDIILYSYWGYHFDATIFFYLTTPKEAFASASFGEIIVGAIFILFFTIQTYKFYTLLISQKIGKLALPNSKLKSASVLILLTALLFLPIRGGVTVSTMNVGKVYFSSHVFLNHAAINPQFNLMYSLGKSEDFGSQYQFFEKSEAQDIYEELHLYSATDSIPQLLKSDRPNIILFILESFSASVAVDSIIAPNMVQLAKEGVVFNNFYANSFRTDRGLVSILSGYPAQPTVAIMKYPQKTQSLPFLPKSLEKAGYSTSFYYGGDVDFANMRSYLVGTCGISDIYSDDKFPISQRLTKWGVPDEYLLNRVSKDLTSNRHPSPSLTTVLTLSSHEPFDVPIKKFDEPFLDAVNYTDEQIGKFVANLKKMDQWDNTLIILLADHCMQSYPKGVDVSDPQRFHIPMIWAGGVVREPVQIEDFSSQNDLAATLLSQLNLSYTDFTFSKDILNPSANIFAFYSYMNGFAMMDSLNSVIYDNDKSGVVQMRGDDTGLERKAKAFFQAMYLDIGER